jgi:dTDP-4-amino-4,6-dideoxygalactose transaminase
MLDLSAQYQQLKGDLMPAIESVLEKASFVNDSEIANMFYYPLPIHKPEVFRTEQNLRICENFSKHVLSLPIGSEMSKENIN